MVNKYICMFIQVCLFNACVWTYINICLCTIMPHFLLNISNNSFKSIYDSFHFFNCWLYPWLTVEQNFGKVLTVFWYAVESIEI